MNVVKKSFQYGAHTVTLETGTIAKQASGAVLVRMDDTVILVTVVGKQSDDVAGRDFFPLTVNYQERTYAAGRIPGGYFKREGRPTEKETLTSRLIDRPIRPLFPDGFKHDVQIVATVMSVDPQINADIPAMIGASAALAVSGIPFDGPIAGARVGYIDGDFILNPTKTQLETSALDLVVAGAKDAILMVESEAHELTEQQMLDAVLFGHSEMQVAVDAISALAAETSVVAWDWQPPEVNTALHDQIQQLVGDPLAHAYTIKEKQQRYDAIAQLKRQAIEALFNEETGPQVTEIESLFNQIEKNIVRGRIIAKQPRIDGRDLTTVRPITIDTSVLPRTHGSALFTRGETQAIVVSTLGTERDAQLVDAIDGERKDPFMLHYNFPPYCVGETGMMSGPKRREIGHGNLAKRAIVNMLPTQDDFPYVIRTVSEITESNGSSSMATVCGTSLSLMDAGVPIKAPVAGIAMGLVKEGDKFSVLSDILGDEDHLGDMDFKVAGTDQGITALQMDIKISGITKEIMEIALNQAKQGRLHILGEMGKVIHQHRGDVSEHAPRIVSMKVPVDKIRDVIGKGGATIRSIIDEVGVSIDIDDDGVVKIASVDGESAEQAKKRIEDIIAEVEIGKIYQGKVVRIVDFGAFVAVLPGKEGLLHISQIAQHRVANVSDEIQEGQLVNVKVLEIDRQGRFKLSMKEIDQS